ncbi:tetratricopeptide repeat protein [Paenibacillus sp. GYB006]|uniref:tetratricopeptide repeat protein n=1 Tax=Paenibacillus sp. GYB006 TaxID=2994394 RepID=UPI002F966818
MSKFLLFGLLFYIIGNPFIAIIVLFLIFYLLDRRFVGVFPSITKPFKRMRSISKNRQQIALNPNDVTSKFDLARLLIERKKYREAQQLLLSIESSYDHSAEYWDMVGTTEIHQGQLEQGEQHTLHATKLNPKVKYGQPYLRLASAYKDTDQAKALQYVEKFQDIQSSSSESFYYLGLVYGKLGQKNEAKEAYRQSIDVYRSLPKYKKRQERRWAVRSFFRKLL